MNLCYTFISNNLVVYLLKYFVFSKEYRKDALVFENAQERTAIYFVYSLLLLKLLFNWDQLIKINLSECSVNWSNTISFVCFTWVLSQNLSSDEIRFAKFISYYNISSLLYFIIDSLLDAVTSINIFFRIAKPLNVFYASKFLKLFLLSFYF